SSSKSFMTCLRSPHGAQGVSKKRQSAPSGATGPPLQASAAGAAASTAQGAGFASARPLRFEIERGAIVRPGQPWLEPREEFAGAPERGNPFMQDGGEDRGADEDLLPGVAFAVRFCGPRHKPASFGAQTGERFVDGLKAGFDVLTSVHDATPFAS